MATLHTYARIRFRLYELFYHYESPVCIARARKLVRILFSLFIFFFHLLYCNRTVLICSLHVVIPIILSHTQAQRTRRFPFTHQHPNTLATNVDEGVIGAPTEILRMIR